MVLNRLALSVFVSLLACTAFAQTTANLVGTWKAADGPLTIVLVLNADGTGTLDDEKIAWKVNGSTLTINEDGEINNYTFELSGSRLRLSGGDLDQPMVFERDSPAGPSGAGGRSAQAAGEAPDSGEARPAAKGSAVGTWEAQGPEGPVRLVMNSDGTGTLNGEAGTWELNRGILILKGGAGAVLVLNAALTPDTLTVSGGNLPQPIVFRRAGSKKPAETAAGGAVTAGAARGAGGVRQELVGKWCYFGNVNALSGGGRMTEECFTLQANGTYQYFRESSASAYAPGVYGATSSQGSDSGTWTATDTTITANSRTQGQQTYALEKRNHPKNRDPMLCLDGRCFVTFHQRSPW